MTDIPEAGNDKAKLVPCTNCGRTFLDDRIETHMNICTNHKSREVIRYHIDNQLINFLDESIFLVPHFRFTT